MRLDGRNQDELREVTIVTDYLKHPEGSVLITVGYKSDMQRKCRRPCPSFYER